MASKRRSNSYNNFRLQTETQKWETKGTKPLPDPVSVQGALLLTFIHVCRRYLFINTNIKIGIYLASLFVISFLADVLPFPKTYFSNSDNVLNQYFVKWGWLWTLIVTVPFSVLTSFTYSCGRRELVFQHVSRIVVATIMWYVITNVFNVIEYATGKCSMSKGSRLLDKETCLKSGFYWHCLDLSGHAFILIYSNLMMIEEARAIIGWETIRDLIRNEEYSRSIKETGTLSPLRSLSQKELSILKAAYFKFTPYIRGFFVCICLLTILWDIMLFFTELYFHIMVEKLISGIIAITVWFLTYKVWYTFPSVLPNLPGEGLFKYITREKSRDEIPKRSSLPSNSSRPGQLPTFMGMPLYGLKQPLPAQDSKDSTADNDNDITTDGELFNIKVTNLPSKVNLGTNSQRSGPVTRSQTNSKTNS